MRCPLNPPESVVPVAGERLIRLPELLSITGESRSQTYAKIAAGLMPAPIKDGRSSLWVLSEIHAHLAHKIASSKRKA